jgi:catecholate siderophore receptor
MAARTIDLDLPGVAALINQHPEDQEPHGIPLRNFAPVPGVSRSNYYGFSDIDSDAVSAIFSHDFGSSAMIRNLTRWENYDRLGVTDAAEGRICFAPGEFPLGTNLKAPGTTLRCGAAGASPLEGVGGPTYTPAGPIGNVRDNNNRIIANQTDLTLHFGTGAVAHSLVTGVSVSKENFTQTVGADYRNPNGTTYLLAPESLFAPHHDFNQPVNYAVVSHADSKVENQALYAFDTLKFTEQWMLGVGARYEHNKATYSSFTATPVASLTVAPGPLVAAATNPLVKQDDLLSYRAALVYKPVEAGSVYVEYGNSKVPSTSTVNGSCGTSCSQDPQDARTYELGAKWDLLHGQAALTGAVFRTDRTNYLVASGDPAIPVQQLDGRARVDGVQIGLAGSITHRWQLFANYAHLRSEVLQSVSDRVLAGGGIDAQAGNPLANQPVRQDVLHAVAFVIHYQRLGESWTGAHSNTRSDYVLLSDGACVDAVTRSTSVGMVLYSATTVHRVEAITRGERLASFFWIQSMVRDDGQRALLFDLDVAIQKLNKEHPTHPSAVELVGVYHNLLRRWTEL